MRKGKVNLTNIAVRMDDQKAAEFGYVTDFFAFPDLSAFRYGFLGVIVNLTEFRH